MDKRFLLFLLCVTLSYSVVQFFFSSLDRERKQSWLEEQKRSFERSEKERERELEARRLSPSKLPLLQLAEKEGAPLSIWSYHEGKATILFQKEKVAIPALKGQIFHPLAPFSLYLPTKDDVLSLYNPPSTGEYDLHLLSIEEGQPRLSLATLRDGKVVTLYSQEKPPLTDALAILEVDSLYYPIGYYLAKEKRFHRFEKADYLKEMKSTTEVATTEQDEKGQQFYLVETPSMQVVISKKGGALAEINLPFHRKDRESPVKEIEIDRSIMAESPKNAVFPLQTTGEPFSLGGFYPLLRRDLEGRQVERIEPHYYALDIISQYPEVANLPYEVIERTDHSITLVARQPQRKITKKYTFPPAIPYVVELEVRVEGESQGLWITSGIPEVELISGSPAPEVKYRLTRGGKAEVEKLELPKDSTTITSFHPDWVSNSNGFFGLILDPLTEIPAGFRVHTIPASEVPTRLLALDDVEKSLGVRAFVGYEVLLPLKQTSDWQRFRLYAGPLSSDTLAEVDQAYRTQDGSYNPDYILCQSYHGFFSAISEPFAKFLLVLLRIFHNLTDSWAFSIVLLTLALRIILYPLNAWSTRSSLKMQAMAPKLQALQERYKKDPQKLQKAMMELYREEKANPLSGCLPILIQMPFLFGMFDLLRTNFELRGASFIPGWIDNLAAPDVLFTFGFHLPILGNGFHLLPILLGATMFLQQRIMTPLPKDPKMMTEQQRQSRAMQTLMPVIFTVMFYQVPSGLNIYWLSSTLMGILQHLWTARMVAKKSVDRREEKMARSLSV